MRGITGQQPVIRGSLTPPGSAVRETDGPTAQDASSGHGG
ncbi:hypothetical protein HMPREF1129_0133 [Actinomyces naeslundii str. Howell 279]|uniref:Uncharacterized protein n=1 Tax=Actinomyces naeslundii (strain ATCC 12104 / DSM 43013 / CCUG 2238 / JCM 8349 / NCTC 10301 / Howell 279) TaxID=1115803 RepID=J3F4L3_ACTNH|nr:hypothetical protein HMPREF1129_0133 [Actinomyces naeslundii str. Howell 279]